jgi:hypothetical protein
VEEYSKQLALGTTKTKDKPTGNLPVKRNKKRKTKKMPEKNLPKKLVHIFI